MTDDDSLAAAETPRPKPTIKVEKLGDFDSSMATLRDKFGAVSGAAGKSLMSLGVDREKFRAGFGTTKPGGLQALLGIHDHDHSAVETLARLRPLADLPDPKTQPAHRTMTAVERMAGDIEVMADDIEVLAKAALDTDKQNRHILFWAKIAVLVGVLSVLVALIK